MISQLLHIKHVSCKSTNLIAEQFIDTGSPVCISTSYQTAGRGQTGNTWSSAKSKNLLVSYILHPDFLSASQQFSITEIVSLALMSLLKKYLPDSAIKIKWPNDIYISDYKIAGILIENRIMQNSILSSVIGIGLNVNQVRFPKWVPNPTSIKKISKKRSKIDNILNELSEEIFKYYEIARNDISEIHKKYLENLYQKNILKPYKFEGKKIEATIIDVDNFGIISLETENSNIIKAAFKEIEFL